ncbi:MAG: hypothetical protein AAGH92_03595, partial [Planctomycetota bacterium]
MRQSGKIVGWICVGLTLMLHAADVIGASGCPSCGGVGSSAVGLNVLPEAEPESQEPAPSITPSPAVTRLLDGPVLDDAAKQRARVFHGRWDELSSAGLPTS